MRADSSLPAKVRVDSSLPAKLSVDSSLPAKLRVGSSLPAKLSVDSGLPARSEGFGKGISKKCGIGKEWGEFLSHFRLWDSCL